MMTMEAQNLVLNNLGLVNGVLKKYTWHDDYEDIKAQGYEGLCYAASRYDKNAGVQFSTYATKVIYGFIVEYLRNYCNGPIKPYFSRVGKKEITHYPELFYLDKPMDGDARYDEDSWYDKLPNRDSGLLDACVALTDLRTVLTNRYGERDTEMFFLYFNGYQLREIGEVYGLTHQRVYQVVDKLRKYTRTQYNKEAA